MTPAKAASALPPRNGGDLVWEVGTGYFGCRNEDGRFHPGELRRQRDHAAGPDDRDQALARAPNPAMAASCRRQGHAGDRRDPRRADGRDCISPSRHSAFSTPIEMMEFIAQLRTLSGGKPVGFKLCIGHPWEFMGIVKAMLETGISPDFIVVDGAEGGTGAAPTEFTDHVGVPMREGLLFVHNTLVGANLRDRIKIGAAGKIVSALRHRQRAGARRRLGQRGARLHVRARLHPVADAATPTSARPASPPRTRSPARHRRLRVARFHRERR